MFCVLALDHLSQFRFFIVFSSFSTHALFLEQTGLFQQIIHALEHSNQCIKISLVFQCQSSLHNHSSLLFILNHSLDSISLGLYNCFFLFIFVLLYLTFARFDEALLIMATLPFALTGGAWFLYLLGFNLSVATGVGFIALAGVSAEFGVIMLLYLKNAWTEREDGDLLAAITEGAVMRVRPKAMTVAVIIAGLLPILWGTGAGSEVMSRIAAPMIGGMITAPLLSLFIIPAAYKLIWLRRHKKSVS